MNTANTLGTPDAPAFDIADWLGDWESFEHYIDSDDTAIQQTWEAAERAVLANPRMAPMAAHGIRTFWSMACTTTSPENIIHIGWWRVSEPDGTDGDVNGTTGGDTTNTSSGGTSDNADTATAAGVTASAVIRIEWFAEDNTSLDVYDYRLDHVIAHGLEGSPTFVFTTDDPNAEDSPFRWLLAIAPLPSRKAFAEGGLLSHLHFQYANDLHTLVSSGTDGGKEGQAGSGEHRSNRNESAGNRPGEDTVIGGEPDANVHTDGTASASATETLRNPRWYATMCADEGTAEDRCTIIRALHHLQ
ncbi:ABC transporter ATP-binding protein [Bifidobacterium myosotis]|uniref:ABC transporter ATP-binding protein n=1 Tax=Bifidobacterium myosotis TaxID=1630166 RepID=A0A261FEK5_9BIFI|nr:hypothetical protein [Bifidobacterium myosotis]OZG57465.1 ABC transporter ATP-binding protein [Bifidobacterium myosotis]